MGANRRPNASNVPYIYVSFTFMLSSQPTSPPPKKKKVGGFWVLLLFVVRLVDREVDENLEWKQMGNMR
jgi:hypothetical protein